MQIEQIDWIDSGAWLGDEWHSLDVYKSRIKGWTGHVTTIGTVMHEDENVVVLGLSKDLDNDAWYGAQLIYKPCIVYRRTLE